MNRELTSNSEMTFTLTTSSHMVSLSTQALVKQNLAFRGSGGVSQGNAEQGFRPAFLDQTTGSSYLSRFADGSIAPLHVLDGLPHELMADRDLSGRVTAKDYVVAGFLRRGVFYTREQAARAVSH